MYRILGADGKEYGPVTGEVLRQWVSQGRANALTKVKPEGGADWQTLASVPEFEAAFAAAPGAAPPAPLPAAPAEAKTSGMAITSLVMGILGICGITAVVGLILGIIALVKINRSGGRLSGNGLAIAGICVSGFMLLFSIPFMAALTLPALARAKSKAQTINCINNVKQLALGVFVYADANGNQCPPASTWCDAILKNVGSEKVFVCPGASPGSRCHYAFNRKLGGLSTAKITNPARTVMIFESDGGWNSSGGRELITLRPRHGQRFIVGFADGHVESLTESQLAPLVWDP
jgi:prepilin-type processing-associated H-X9-DG protein